MCLLPFLPDDLACPAAGLTATPIPALVVVAATARTTGIVVSCWIGANAEAPSTAQWSIVTAGSGPRAGLALLYGERLQQWLMAHLAENDSGARSSPPSHEG